MSRGNDLCPSIDAVLEEEPIGFDFGPMLAQGVTLLSIEELIVTVEFGVDADPASRVLSTPQIVPSPTTGHASQAVAVMFGTAIGGVTYRLQCVCVASDDSHPSVWGDFPCVAPF